MPHLRMRVFERIARFLEPTLVEARTQGLQNLHGRGQTVGDRANPRGELDFGVWRRSRRQGLTHPDERLEHPPLGAEASQRRENRDPLGRSPGKPVAEPPGENQDPPGDSHGKTVEEPPEEPEPAVAFVREVRESAGRP